MNEHELLALAEDFYKEDFTMARAEQAFGPPSSSPLPAIVLASRDPNIEWVHVEPSGEAAAGEPFVAGLSLQFRRPVDVDFTPWQQAFGDFKETPRLHPNQDIPYQFTVHGRPMNGYLLLRAAAKVDSPVKPVHSVILRRSSP